jgi:hypothetical protein
MIAPAPDNTNESFFLYGVENTGFEVSKKPTITSDDEVIVQIKKTGYVRILPHDKVVSIGEAPCLYYRICGSDVHYFCHGRIGVSSGRSYRDLR